MTTRRRAPAATAKAARLMRSARLVIVSGLSGSGKSQAFRALEDLGYFCVDNLPVPLLPTLAELTTRSGTGLSRAAVVIDVRQGAQLGRFPSVYRALGKMPGISPFLIFLDASDETLVRRFSETRRPHPLAPSRSALEGIREERTHLDAVRALADVRLDTTDTTVHELRQTFMSLSRDSQAERSPVVTLLSFGFKHGLPPDADLVFDVRFLANPHFVPELRARTGRDHRIARFLLQYPETGEFLERTGALLRFLLPRYAHEGKSYVTVAIGCTGGRHRSVFVAEALRRRLTDVPGVRLRVRHRDVGVP
jgi:UPF0042 nucleotide-binding protein